MTTPQNGLPNDDMMIEKWKVHVDSVERRIQRNALYNTFFAGYSLVLSSLGVTAIHYQFMKISSGR